MMGTEADSRRSGALMERYLAPGTAGMVCVIGLPSILHGYGLVPRNGKGLGIQPEVPKWGLRIGEKQQCQGPL
jgi:hypothetical protein